MTDGYYGKEQNCIAGSLPSRIWPPRWHQIVRYGINEHGVQEKWHQLLLRCAHRILKPVSFLKLLSELYYLQNAVRFELRWSWTEESTSTHQHCSSFRLIPAPKWQASAPKFDQIIVFQLCQFCNIKIDNTKFQCLIIRIVHHFWSTSCTFYLLTSQLLNYDWIE